MTNDTFEDRLLAELRQVVADRPAPASAPARSIPPRRRPWLVAAGTATAAAAGAAILVAGGSGAAPAYAVDRQDDGTVTVSVRSLADADGLEAKLRDAGIAAEVDYTPTGKMCREPRGRPASGPGHAMSTSMRDGEVSFTLSPADVGPGRTLVISASTGNGVTSLSTGIVEGAVAPCELVEAPAIPAAPKGKVTSERGLSTGAEPAAPSGKVTSERGLSTGTGGGPSLNVDGR